jgi:ribosomal protein S26
MDEKCQHGKVELLGEQKGERGMNKYFRCLKCGNVLILSEEGVLYEVPAAKRQSV